MEFIDFYLVFLVFDGLRASLGGRVLMNLVGFMACNEDSILATRPDIVNSR